MLRNLLLALLGILAAAPVAARMTVDELCGGLGARGAWIGPTPEESDVARAAAPFRARVRLSGKPHLVHLFWVSEPVEVLLEAIETGGEYGSARIELRDMDGAVLARNNAVHFGELYTARYEIPLDKGVYCLITSGRESVGARTSVGVGRTDQAGLTDALLQDLGVVCDPASTTWVRNGPIDDLLDRGVTVPAWVPFPDIGEFTFSFRLEEPAPLAIVFRPTEEDRVEAYTNLWRAPNHLIEWTYDDADNRPYGHSGYVPFPVPAGRYCVKLTTWGAGEVTIRRYRPEDAIPYYLAGYWPPPADSPVQVADLGVLDGPLSRKLAVRNNVEWLRFTLNEAATVEIAARPGRHADPEIALFDRFDLEFGRRDGWDDPDSVARLVERLEPGAYRVAIRNHTLFDPEPSIEAGNEAGFLGRLFGRATGDERIDLTIRFVE